MTTIGLNMKVKFKDYDASADVREASRRLMVSGGVRLRSIMIEEASKRSDGKGSAVYKTGLTQSIVILSEGYDHVAVGTNINYAKKLAFGDPDPTVRAQEIYDWANYKDILKYKGKSKKYFDDNPEAHPFVKNVTRKIRTKGPIANPFHERTKKKFLKEWPGIQREALGK